MDDLKFQNKESTKQTNSNTNNLFDACESSITQHRQSVEGFQLECVRSWKAIIDSTVSFQQDLVRRNGTDIPLPNVTQKLIQESMDYATKFVQSQNIIASQCFASATQSIKAANQNFKPFTKLYDSVTNLWIPK